LFAIVPPKYTSIVFRLSYPAVLGNGTEISTANRVL